jgi:hypothetical protein
VPESELAPRTDPTGPRLIGQRYQVERLLGQGGMGKVFAVVDGSTGRRLALKLLEARHPTRGKIYRRQLWFRREFHTVAHLRHPSILEVYDYGIDEAAGAYYTMELLGGVDLRGEPLEVAAACQVLRDVASALAYLHARNLVHRDLAPGNVYRLADGRAKLIDFGVLATVGLVGDVAGTPPVIAPESVRRMPIDGRADLFGLGALGYYLLTGRHAYPARAIEGLEAAWRQRPPAIGEQVSAVPEALEALIGSLLSLDPQARPRSAAEVMERLGAIAGLGASPEVESVHGYLASSSLVGRQREMATIRRGVAKAIEGNGRGVSIEAASGAGKSRLLREVGLEAQLAGAAVLQAGSDAAGRGPYGVVHELARELARALPEDAVATARTHAGTLARVLPDLAPLITGAPPLEASTDPAEERLRVQAALSGWFLAVSERRPLVLLVDDLQRCDEASAAVLATLVHEAPTHRLLVAVAIRSDEPVLAAAAVANLREASATIRLRGLDAQDVEQLVSSLFGEVPQVRRLAQWARSAAGGTPLHTLELLRQLVDRGTIHYEDGLWVIPEELGPEELPGGLREAMRTRIDRLGADARALAEALSVHGGELSLELCVLLSEEKDEERVFAELDELQRHEVLIGAGESFRFRHDGLREALLGGLGAERRRALHLRVGESLARDGVPSDREEEVGWHLLHGGERARGAELLRRAGLRLYQLQSFRDAIHPLEAALSYFEAVREARICVELRHLLLMAGCMADRTVALRYVDPTVEAFRRHAGVALAARLGRVLGRHLGLALGLLLTALRWLATPRRARGPGPIEALRTFFVVVGYAATVYAISFDLGRLRALLALVEPLAIFRRRVPYAVYLLACNLLSFPLGRLGEVRRRCRELLRILETDRVTPLSELDRRTGEGGARYLLALTAVPENDPAYLEELERLERLQLRFYEIGIQQARLCYHRWRGEEEAALAIQAATENLFVRLGSAWQMEAWLPVVTSHTYALTHDMLGLKRAIHQLERLVAQGYGFEAQLALARGEYQRERGELEASAASLAQALALLPDGEGLMRPAALSALAETLLARGELERAERTAREGITLGADPDRRQVVYLVRSERVLALCEAARGERASATGRLERLLVEAGRVGNPALLGSVHETRARLAEQGEDAVAFQAHALEADRCYRETRNPVLIARAQALLDPRARRGAARGEEAAQDAQTVTSPTHQASDVSAVMTGCRGRLERAERALELLLRASGGSEGYLYLVREDGALELCAPQGGEEPARDRLGELERSIRRVEEGSSASSEEPAEGAEPETYPPSGWAEEPPAGPLALVLSMRVGNRPRAVGGALIDGAASLRRPAPALLEQIGIAFWEAGDVSALQSR